MTSIVIKEYVAVEGSRFNNADARKIGPVLHALSEVGAVTARDVVDSARSENSPLHSYFEWDDRVAADLWRIEDARRMLRSIQIKYVDGDGIETKTARAFQTVQTKAYETEPRKYRTFEVLHGDSAFAAQMMDSAIDDLLNWRRKYEPYCDMWMTFGDVFQQVINQVDELSAEVKVSSVSGETDAALVQLLSWREEYEEILTIWTGVREQIEFIMKAIASAETTFAAVNEHKERNCLKCRRPFMSVSVGNRICKTCLNQKTFNEKSIDVIAGKVADRGGRK